MDPRIALSLAGVALSMYALYIEEAISKDPQYVAMCDLHAYVSCSDVVVSEHGHGFGLIKYVLGSEHWLSNMSNSAIGLVFYSSLAVVAMLQAVGFARLEKFILMGSVISCVGSAWLIFVLVFVMFDFCVLCFATHVVNFTLLALSLSKLERRNGTKSVKTT